MTEAFCPVAPGRARGMVFARTLDVVRMLVRILKSAISFEVLRVARTES